MTAGETCDNGGVTLRLSKHHSTGNDFLVALVSEPSADGEITVNSARFLGQSAVALCHRRRGVGADGLVLGVESAEGVRMRLWNADGSEAEISGNGLRCLAQALTRGTNDIDVEIDTPAGPRRCRIEPGAGSATGRVEMGAVALDSAAPDLDRLTAALAQVEGFTGRWRTGSVGNPHAVVEVADPGSVDLESAGAAVEACFAGGANVHFAAAAGPRRVRMRIWERGAGVTESCGSGAVVAAAVFDAWAAGADAAAGAGSAAGADPGAAAGAGVGGESAGADASAGAGVDAGNGPGEIVVAMPGGEARVHLGPPAALTGPVVHVADIELSGDVLVLPGWGAP